MADPAKLGAIALPISAKGQSGSIPQIAFGTLLLEGQACVDAVAAALGAGYRHIDTALVYGNQEAVGTGIVQSGVPRDQIFVTSKVAFFPANAEGVWNPSGVPTAYCEKGGEEASIDLCLKQLGLDYVDLMLVHTPCTHPAEFKAACMPHFFELFNAEGAPIAIRPLVLPDGDALRPIIMAARLQAAKQVCDSAAACEARKRTWAALERALRAGKTRFIGVSNWPAELMEEMAGYAEIMPAVNQIEMHPRFASPNLVQVAKNLGCVITGYGLLKALKIECPATSAITAMAAKHGHSPLQVVVRWMIQKGVVAVVKSTSPSHLAENLQAHAFELSAEDVAALDALHEDYPYYWWHEPSRQTLA